MFMDYRYWGRALLAALLLLVACEQSMNVSQSLLEESVLDDIAWSFSEPVPGSPEELVKAVDAYHKQINFPHSAASLNLPSRALRIDATYKYYVQRENGGWDAIPALIRIDGRGKLLTYADILWQLHVKAHEHLKGQDHHFFEGLHLLPNSYETGVPAYEVYLGS
jgi:hypothetical protein